MDEKNKKVIQRIEGEISRIDKKENKVFFFVIDTKGVPSGSLAYIYELAMILKGEGYDVTMLHTEDEFVGVGDWLGADYATLPHENVNGSEIATTVSDVLFIPDIYANVMNQTKQLPCKRVAILQNYDFVVEQVPFGAQWGDFKIMDAITNSSYQARQLHGIFPYVATHKVTPFIDKVFGNTKEPKKMIVNIVAKNQSDINKVVKPFYWNYPSFKWVSFRDIRGESREKVAQLMREAAITIWIDEDASFGYSALEAMKSGSIVMSKIPKTELEWEFDAESGEYRNCCVWFDDYNTLHKQLASVVRSWITDRVPEILEKETAKVTDEFNRDRTKVEFITAFNDILGKRVDEMQDIINDIKKQDKEG